MNLAVLAVGVALSMVPSIMAKWPFTPASTAARVSRFSYISASIAMTLAVISTALPTLLAWVGLTAAGALCERVFVHGLLTGDVSRFVAVVVLAMIVAAFVGARRVVYKHRQSLRIEPGLGHHVMIGDVSVVVLTTADAIAYTLNEPTPQIVLSSGLLQQLDAEEQRVVVAHELAHLELGHHRHLRMIAVIERLAPIMPWLRPGVVGWRLALERWADERVYRTGSRKVDIWSALVKAATCGPTPALSFAGGGPLKLRHEGLMRLDTTNTAVQVVGWWTAALIPTAFFGTLTSMWIFHTHSALSVGIACPL